MSSSLEVLSKSVIESIVFDMDFSKQLSTAETISSITSVVSVIQNRVESSTNITIGIPVSSGAVVQFRISDGYLGECYEVTAIIVTSNGNTREGSGILIIE